MSWYLDQNAFFQVVYFMFFLGFIGEVWVISGFIYFRIGPLLIFLMQWLTVLLWSTRIVLDMEEDPRGVMLRYETNIPSQFHGYNWQGVIDLILVVTMVLTPVLIVEMISRSSLGFERMDFVWLVTYASVLVPVLLGQAVELQTIWLGIDGVFEWNAPNIPDLPSVDDPWALKQFCEEMRKTSQPNIKFLNYLDDNKEVMTHRCELMPYVPFVGMFTYMFNNWGEKVREYVHLLHLFVLSSLSPYHMFNLIPLYQRYQFYTYLEALYKMNLFDSSYIDLLEFEVEHDKDELQTLNWIVGEELDKSKLKFPWVSYWDGQIYLGEKGWNAIKNRGLELSFIPLENLPNWKQEIIDLSWCYITDFGGSGGRKVLQGNLEVQDKFRYLAKEKPLSQYEIEKEQRKELPREVLVKKAETSSSKKYSDELLFDRFQQTYSGQVDISASEEWEIMWQRLRNMFRGVGSKQFVMILGGSILLLLNTFGLAWLFRNVSLTVGSFPLLGTLLFFEAILILMLAWDPGANQRQLREIQTIAWRGYFTHHQVEFKDRTDTRRLVIIVYATAVLIFSLTQF